MVMSLDDYQNCSSDWLEVILGVGVIKMYLLLPNGFQKCGQISICYSFTGFQTSSDSSLLLGLLNKENLQRYSFVGTYY